MEIRVKYGAAAQPRRGIKSSYHRKSVGFSDLYHRKSVGFCDFNHRKSVIFKPNRLYIKIIAKE